MTEQSSPAGDDSTSTNEPATNAAAQGSNHEVICDGGHEGPCDTVNYRVRTSPNGDIGQVEFWDKGANITLTWRENPISKQRLRELIASIPVMIENVNRDAQVQDHAAEGIDDIESFLKWKSGDCE